MSSFVPRLNLHHKPYKHIVKSDETPQMIAEKHGAGPQGYRELLAANLPRPVRTLAGSPSGSKTFDYLDEGEALNIPAHWPEKAVARALAGVPGALGSAPILDATNPLFVAASTSAHAMFDSALAGSSQAEQDAFLASVINAAVAWYASQGDMGKPMDTALMDRLTYSAGLWSEMFGSAMPPVQAGKFPWGPFGMLLSSAPIAWDTIDWTGGAGVKGAPIQPPAGFAPTMTAPPGFPAGSDWSWIPWDVLGANGGYLEQMPPTAPIVISGKVDQAGVRDAYETAIKAALAPPADCKDGFRHVDVADPTSQCVSICADPAMWNPDTKSCCPLGSAYSATLKTCDCGAGNTYDKTANTCTTGTPIKTDTTTDTPAKKSYVVPVVGGIIGVGIIGWALRDVLFGKKKAE